MPQNDFPSTGPWMVTQVQVQLDAMAGACNELERADREIRFIVPVTVCANNGHERPTGHIAIFSLPRGPKRKGKVRSVGERTGPGR
jgi:hypothetical protein